jgi:hypothetical protein
MGDFSHFGCKYRPQAYDSDICESCIHDNECYRRYLDAMEIFRSGKPVKDAFGIKR